MGLVGRLQDRLYPGADTRDPVPAFLRLVERYVGSQDDVLDLGAGAGENNAYALRGRARRVVGVDLDPRVGANPLLDQGIVADLRTLPFRDASFDVLFSIYVLEHIADPAALVREIHRVLRPGGRFLALTPNRWHYVALASALTPTRFHKWYNQKRGRAAADTFPTEYRMNTRGALAGLFEPEGFETTELVMVEVQPNYLLFSLPSFLLGALYERVVNATPALEALRVNIACVFTRRG